MKSAEKRADPKSPRRLPLRSGVRAGDGTYVCIVFVDDDGKKATVCEKVK